MRACLVPTHQALDPSLLPSTDRWPSISEAPRDRPCPDRLASGHGLSRVQAAHHEPYMPAL